jgi:hypothetical protein
MNRSSENGCHIRTVQPRRVSGFVPLRFARAQGCQHDNDLPARHAKTRLGGQKPVGPNLMR